MKASEGKNCAATSKDEIVGKRFIGGRVPWSFNALKFGGPDQRKKTEHSFARGQRKQ